MSILSHVSGYLVRKFQHNMEDVVDELTDAQLEGKVHRLMSDIARLDGDEQKMGDWMQDNGCGIVEYPMFLWLSCYAYQWMSAERRKALIEKLKPFAYKRWMMRTNNTD